MENFSLNLDTLISCTSASSTARILALSLQVAGGYLSPGDLLKKIPDEFLAKVCDDNLMLEDLDYREKVFGELMEVALVLNHAEGGTIEETEVSKLVNSTLVLVTMESLSRKGLVELEYQNASLTDRKDAPLVKLTEHGKDIANQLRGNTGDQNGI